MMTIVMPSHVALFLMICCQRFLSLINNIIVVFVFVFVFLVFMSPPFLSCFLLLVLSPVLWKGFIFHFLLSLLRTTFSLFPIISLFCFTSMYDFFTFPYDLLVFDSPFLVLFSYFFHCLVQYLLLGLKLGLFVSLFRL